MQAKKRYILVFVSCAFLAYCYFGGYRLKRPRVSLSSASKVRPHHEHIVIPIHLSSFLSSIECNGIDDFSITTNKHDNGKGIGGGGAGTATQTRSTNNNDDIYRQGSQISTIATVQTNIKLKGMFFILFSYFIR